jgi:hypothetical protein
MAYLFHLFFGSSVASEDFAEFGSPDPEEYSTYIHYLSLALYSLHLHPVGKFLTGQMLTPDYEDFKSSSLSISAESDVTDNPDSIILKDLLLHVLGLALRASEVDRLHSYLAEIPAVDEATDALKYACFTRFETPLIFQDDYTASRVVIDRSKRRLLSDKPIERVRIRSLKDTDNIKLILKSGIQITSLNVDCCGILQYLASTKYYTVNESCIDEITADNIQKISNGIYVKNLEQLRHLHRIKSNLAIHSPKLIFNKEYVLNVSNYQEMAACADEISRILILLSSVGTYDQQVIFKSVKGLAIVSESINLQNITFQEIGKLTVYGKCGYETLNSIRNLPKIPEVGFNTISTSISSLPGDRFKALSFKYCKDIRIISDAVTTDKLEISKSTVEDLSKFTVKEYISLESGTTIVSGELNKVLLDGQSIELFKVPHTDYKYLKFTENVNHLKLDTYDDSIRAGLMEILPSNIRSIHIRSFSPYAEVPVDFVAKFNRIQMDVTSLQLREQNWPGYEKNLNSENSRLILKRINRF